MMCFQGGPLNSSLYYRKVGHGPDGWVVGMGVEESSFLITTRFITHKIKVKLVWDWAFNNFKPKYYWYVPN